MSVQPGIAASALSQEPLPWHGADGLFRNPPGSPLAVGSSSDWYGFIWRRLGKRHVQHALPTGHVLPEAAVLAGIAALAGADGVTWLGHSCFLIRLGGRTVITDPYLSTYASPVPRLGPRRYAGPGLAADRLPPVDLVLLSHNHYDHMDLPALRVIAQRSTPVLVTGLGVGRYLKGLPFAAVHELDWYQEVEAAGLAVTGLPALHFSKRSFFDRNATLWCALRVGDGRRSVHFAGDTAFGPVFEEVGRRYPGPDLALVPIGAYEPRPLMQGGHCTPEEAVAIGRMIGAGRLMAMHWGTITLTDEPPFEPPQRFEKAALAAGYPAQAIGVPAIGQTIAI